MKPSSGYLPTETKAVKAAKQAEVLDNETQALLQSLRDKDKRFRVAATIFFLILFTVGVFGIYYQNYIAQKNQNHIDCIVQLFRTHTKNANDRRYIADSNPCHIIIVKAKK